MQKGGGTICRYEGPGNPQQGAPVGKDIDPASQISTIPLAIYTRFLTRLYLSSCAACLVYCEHDHRPPEQVLGEGIVWKPCVPARPHAQFREAHWWDGKASSENRESHDGKDEQIKEEKRNLPSTLQAIEEVRTTPAGTSDFKSIIPTQVEQCVNVPGQ